MKWHPSKYSADKRNKIRRMAVKDYKKHLSLAETARIFGVKRETIQNWVRKYDCIEGITIL
jgi:transposase-like protein